MIYLSDIDGTIADLTHRLPLIKVESPNKPDWRAFFKACRDDAPIHDVIALEQDLYYAHNRFMYVTGRSDEVRKETSDWLGFNKLPPGPLFMRKEGDYRPDHIVKSELIDKLLKEYNLLPHEIGGIFEDRTQVVKMYRERGFRVYQVAEGDF